MIRVEIVLQTAAIIVAIGVPLLGGLVYFERRLSRVETNVAMILDVCKRYIGAMGD